MKTAFVDMQKTYHVEKIKKNISGILMLDEIHLILERFLLWKLFLQKCKRCIIRKTFIILSGNPIIIHIQSVSRTYLQGNCFLQTFKIHSISRKFIIIYGKNMLNQVYSFVNIFLPLIKNKKMLFNKNCSLYIKILL